MRILIRCSSLQLITNSLSDVDLWKAATTKKKQQKSTYCNSQASSNGMTWKGMIVCLVQAQVNYCGVDKLMVMAVYGILQQQLVVCNVLSSWSLV